jgi:cholest-4-en-3-one 26-monooxygenase
MRLADVDIFDPDIFASAVPHDAFRLLRKEAPVHFQKEPNGRGYWALTKYEDVVAVSRDPGRFSSHRGGTNIQDYPEDHLTSIQLLMLNMDPPQHNKFRRLASQGFTPRMVQLLEPRIRSSTKKILDRISNKGSCDFVKEIAAELPLIVIAELMGIPADDRVKIFDWSNRLIGFDDPEFQTNVDDARVAAMEMWMYANELAEDRKGKKGEDLVTVLINAEVDGAQLTEMEFDAFFLLLAVAGNETTRNLISGGFVTLNEQPAERQRLLENPQLLPTAIEEMLRWVPPVMYFRRTAMRDTEIRGQKIRDGEKVCMYYSSANRDEDVFPNSETFDITRTPNDHLAFGVGQHHCLGSNLARLEIRVIFEELLRRFPDMEIGGPIRRLRSNFINGYKTIPVRYSAGKE